MFVVVSADGVRDAYGLNGFSFFKKMGLSPPPFFLRPASRQM